MSHLPTETERVRGPVEWAANYLGGLSVDYLNRARLIGDGPAFFKIGRRVIYDRADLDAWLANRRRHSTSETTVAA